MQVRHGDAVPEEYRNIELEVHACPLCDYTSYSKSHVIRHIKPNHIDVGECPPDILETLRYAL